MGLLMAAIVAVTMLGLVYLTQTLGTNATSTEIGLLQTKRNELITDIKRLEIEALDMTQAEVIVPKARKQNLKRLGAPIVLPAP
jgi:cell division protein FtsL